MSALKTGLVVAGVFGGGIGLLFATGVISVKGNDSKRSPTKSTPSEKTAEGDEGDGSNIDSLPYLGAIPISEEDRGKEGVTKHVKGKAGTGLGVFNPCGWGQGAKRAPKNSPWLLAELVNPEGEILHTWSSEAYRGERRGWAIARIDDEASAYTVVADRGVVKIGWDNETKWTVDGIYHHDLSVRPDRGVLVLAEKSKEIDFEGETYKILDHGVTFLSPDGEVEKQLWFYDAFKDTEAFKARVKKSIAKRKKQKKKKQRHGFDAFHANAVKLMKKDGPEGTWKAGDILVSFRHQDTISVISAETGKIQWSFGPGTLDHQHDPSELDNGNVLVFDNGAHRKFSRVLEIDPKTNEVAWEYKAPKKKSLFTLGRGLAQKIPNGNVLISSSNQGRAFEVTPEGEVVWEYYTKYRLGDKRVPFRGERLSGAPLAAVRAKLGLPAEDGAAPVAEGGAEAKPAEGKAEEKPSGKPGGTPADKPSGDDAAGLDDGGDA